MTDSLGMDGATRSGFVLDACHNKIGPGDAFIGEYRGRPNERFVVLEDDGRGMFRFRDPDGVERPMRPSTMLAGVQAGRFVHIHAGAERRWAFEAIAYMRRHDCDFLTVENVSHYAHVSAVIAAGALTDAGFPAS